PKTSPDVAENKEYISPQKRKINENSTKNAIGAPAILVTRNTRTASTPNVRNIVYSRPNRSETVPHRILDRALQADVRVAVSGTIARPHIFASLTLRDLAICERFPVAIRPPAHAKKNIA